MIYRVIHYFGTTNLFCTSVTVQLFFLTHPYQSWTRSEDDIYTTYSLPHHLPQTTDQRKSSPQHLHLQPSKQPNTSHSMSSQGNTIEFTQDEVRYFKVGIQAQLAKYDDLKIERFGVKPNLNELYPNDPLRNVAKMHTAIIYQAFRDTVEGEETGKNTEDYVGRYVNMLLIRNFCILDFGWNIVPQYYTKSSKFPDLVL